MWGLSEYCGGGSGGSDAGLGGPGLKPLYGWDFFRRAKALRSNRRAKAKATARTKTTAKANTGVLRFAQNDDVKTSNNKDKAKATAEADPYGMTNRKAKTKATATT